MTSKILPTITAVLLSVSVAPVHIQIHAEEDIPEKTEVIEEANPEEVIEEEILEEDAVVISNEEIEPEEENYEISGPVPYYDENRESHICSNYQLLSDVKDEPGVTISGWYVAEGSGWGFNNRVTILGDVNIILTDNCHVIFNRGIQNNEWGNLSVWGQTAGSGRMDCVQAFETSGGNAGIGGDNSTSGGTFNLHGGTVNANGQNGGAGVGGGQYCYGGFINIYGGTLNANGGNNAAGIGGGQYGDSGAIRIYGGSVTATGGAGTAGGAGIGGGEDRSGGDIHIYGGTVSATGGNGSFGAGAGIGGGDDGDSGTIIISGGDVTARGGNWAAGIGGGNCGNGGMITIDGGYVWAAGKMGGAGIGGGDKGNSGIICLNSANVEAQGTQAIGNGEGGIVESIQMAKGIGIEGKPYEERIYGLRGLTYVRLTNMQYIDKTFTYYDENGKQYECTDYQLLLDVVDQEGITLTSGWYVAEGFGWGFNNRVTINGDVNIVLTDNCGVIFNRGIQNNTYGNLSIWGGALGNGRMDCKQAFEAALSGGNAGIGGDKGSSAGTFNLHGGTVIAKGEKDGAGVGGGKSGNGGTINIYGGTLEATGGTMAAGIGGGSEGSSGSINIYGGVVRAVGGEAGRGSDIGGGAGIGGGDEANADSIIISGGQISAKGNGGGAGIGGGNEGSGNSISISGGVIDARGGYYDSDRACSFEVFSGAGIGGGDDGDSGSISISGGEIYAESTRADTLFDVVWAAGIGAGDDGNENTIVITGGHISAHGFQAVGCGEDGKNGTLQLGDSIWAMSCGNYFPFADRYGYARAYDIELKAR